MVKVQQNEKEVGYSKPLDIESPFGTDSELIEETIFIPEGCYAFVEGDKVVIRKGEKPVSENLKEEATRLFGDCKVRKGAFYLGAQCQKEQMMKDVVLETTIIKDWDGCAEDGNYSEWLAYEDDEVINMPEWCEEGDKVKLILIKGD